MLLFSFHRKVLQLLNCTFNYLQETVGLSIQDLAHLSPNPLVVRGATFLINAKDTFDDMCTEGTDLNTGKFIFLYFRHSTCEICVGDNKNKISKELKTDFSDSKLHS